MPGFQKHVGALHLRTSGCHCQRVGIGCLKDIQVLSEIQINRARCLPHTQLGLTLAYIHINQAAKLGYHGASSRVLETAPMRGLQNTDVLTLGYSN